MMASNQDYIDLFYNCTTKLMELKTQAATDQHEDSYKKLLQAPHWTGQTQLKAMSSQYISEYANYFPGLQNEAFNTQIDFCEDDNNTVRLEGIKSLFTIAIALPSLAIKSADVLVQLLQSEIPDEEVSVRKSLLLLFRKYPKDCTLAILGQIQCGLESVRDAASSFIRKQLLVELQPKMKTKFLKKLIPIVSVTVITNELATLVFELLSCAELEFDGDDDLISFADAATHRLLSYLFELDPVRVDTLFVLLDQYKKLFGYGMPSDKTISAILNYCLGDNSKVTFSPSQKLALLKYVTECTLFIIDSSNVEASFDQELLEQLLDDCMVKIPQTGGEFSAHLLMLEPVLYCMLYFRMKIPVMDRQISTQLYKKLGIIYSKLEELIIASGVTNQSSTSQKVKLFSNNTKAICGVICD